MSFARFLLKTAETLSEMLWWIMIIIGIEMYSKTGNPVYIYAGIMGAVSHPQVVRLIEILRCKTCNRKK